MKDDGCQWARRCGDCPWDDCILKDGEEPLAYDSREAQWERTREMAIMSMSGRTEDKIAEDFGISLSKVKRHFRRFGYSPQSLGYEAIAELHRGGMSARNISKRLNISIRTVQRAVRSVGRGTPY